MKRSRGLWIWSLIVLFVQPIFAQDSLPTDEELHSAYCIPVLNYWVEFYSQLEKTAVADEKTAGNAELRQEALGYSEMMRDLVARSKSELNRLQMSLRPRAQYRTSTALVAATKQGEADIQQYKTNNDRCSTECSTSETVAQRESCTESCVGNDVVARVRGCSNPSWMPF
jgi:hypothetical protein